MGETMTTTEKRFKLSWTKKSLPLKENTLFSKSKHSEEWHQNLVASAGVLHPADPQFPYHVLRGHTDAYLKKKGKITQADADIKLALLISNHDAKDIAVAAAAHAISPTPLRELLRAELNVAHGTFDGLQMWLQSLIAANNGNPASVTELEASWARYILPYSGSDNAPLAGSYLKGFSRALRKSGSMNMSTIPEFSILLQRAIKDFARNLDGYVHRLQWTEAQAAVYWMTELDVRPAHMRQLGGSSLEHILDAQFSIWRAWASWRPNADRITRIASHTAISLSGIEDIMALEGPDVITGAHKTLRDGLIAQHKDDRQWLRLRNLMIQIPGTTQFGLHQILHRLGRDLDFIFSDPSLRDNVQSIVQLLSSIAIAEPLTASGLDLLEATLKVPHSPDNDIYTTVMVLHADRAVIGGRHILRLSKLLRAIDELGAADLSQILLQPWLFDGIVKCIRECQAAIKTRISKSLPWTQHAIELHAFCMLLNTSKKVLGSLDTENQKEIALLPTVEQIRHILEIYNAVQASRPRKTTRYYSAQGSNGLTTSNGSQHGRNKSIASSSLSRPTTAGRTKHALEELIEGLYSGYSLDLSKQPTIRTILHVWSTTGKAQLGYDLRQIALLVSDLIRDEELLCRCLKDIGVDTMLGQSPGLVKEMFRVMALANESRNEAIEILVKILDDWVALPRCWSDVLYKWLGETDENGVSVGAAFMANTLSTMKVAEWLQFMNSLEIILSKSRKSDYPVPPMLQPRFLAWRERVSTFCPTLIRLEKALPKHEVIRYILVCNDEVLGEILLGILQCLKDAESGPSEDLMQLVVGKLLTTGENIQEVVNCVEALRDADDTICEACVRIWDTCHGSLYLPGAPQISAGGDAVVFKGRFNTTPAPHPAVDSLPDYMKKPIRANMSNGVTVAEVMVAGWMRDDNVDLGFKLTIGNLAKVLNIQIYEDPLPAKSILDATLFWNNIQAEMVNELDRIEEMVKALKAKDPKGTIALLKELGYPCDSALEEELAQLPISLRDHVDTIDDQTVEISFPLTSYSDLRRGAMGIPDSADTLILRLFFSDPATMVPSFCIHFNDDENLDGWLHTPWGCNVGSKSPDTNFCGLKQTVFTWQLSRMLHTKLSVTIGPYPGIKALYEYVSDQLLLLGQICVSCGISHNAKNTHLRRSTPCDLVLCARLWYKLPLDIRIPEIRTDIFAVDMLLTSVYAAAVTARTEFLPGCPIRSVENIKTILNALPTMKNISEAKDISQFLLPYHKDAEMLISWACVQFRGYLRTATGLLKVPNLPTGTHQFVLMNGSPKLESQFHAQMQAHGNKSIILFHGTSLDRLPAILTQGLKVCSGTALQRTGAAHGKGIYMAEELATSFSYAPASLSWRNSGLPNMRLMLGCEVAGAGNNKNNGIHVIADERLVMVRYIMLFTNYARTPIAGHVVPALTSGMSLLRSGAV